MESDEPKELLNKGLQMLKRGDHANAVFCFEELLFKSDRSPIALACLGLAMARSKLDLRAAEGFCKEAIQKSPKKADYYRSLAEVYMSQRNKGAAIETLKRGLKVDRTNKGILKELKKFGIRQSPPIPFLPRSNPLNKLLGKLRAKLS